MNRKLGQGICPSRARALFSDYLNIERSGEIRKKYSLYPRMSVIALISAFRPLVHKSHSRKQIYDTPSPALLSKPQ